MALINKVTQEEINIGFSPIVSRHSLKDIIFYSQFVSNPNIADGYGVSPIQQAVRRMQLNDAPATVRYNVVKTVLGLKPDVNILEKGSMVPAMSAFLAKNTGVALLLLKADGADLSAKDSDGNGLLYYATLSRSAEAVEEALRLGCSNTLNKQGQGAFSLAVHNKDFDILEILVQNSLNNKKLEDVIDFEFAQKIVAGLDNKEEIEALLAGKIDKPSDSKGYTTTYAELQEKMARLSTATQKKLRIMWNVDVEKKPVEALTGALIECLENGTPEDILLLLKMGANPTLKDRFGQTPLLKAIQSRLVGMDEKGRVFSLEADAPYRKVKALLKAGADPRQEDVGNTHTLMQALYLNRLGIVKQLIKKEAEFLKETEAELRESIVLKKDRWGDGPLKAAAGCDSPQAIELLVKAGADIDEQDAKGKKALYWAVNADKPDNVMTLLKNGYEWDSTSDEGQEILKLAQSKSTDVLAALQNKYVSKDMPEIQKEEKTFEEKIKALSPEDQQRLLVLIKDPLIEQNRRRIVGIEGMDKEKRSQQYPIREHALPLKPVKNSKETVVPAFLNEKRKHPLLRKLCAIGITLLRKNPRNRDHLLPRGPRR